MRPSWTKPFRIYNGTVIVGKWNKNSYTIIKELGYGANGVVYLANSNKGQVAIKLSDNSISISSEVNVLKSFEKVQGSRLGPSFLDVDDWQTNKGIICFYVMEYINGPNLLDFVSQKGNVWTEVLILQLLTNLQSLHENNWIFGDLKPENLIVSSPPVRLRCIDVGGTTQQNRSVKEFTEFFDRGYWGMGSRKAEVTYDLFSVAMVWINIAYPKRFSKNSNDPNQLIQIVKRHPELSKYEVIIIAALQGKFSSAQEMKQAIIHMKSKSKTTVKHANPSLPKTTGSTAKKGNRTWKTVSLVGIIGSIYSYYLFVYLFL